MGIARLGWQSGRCKMPAKTAVAKTPTCQSPTRKKLHPLRLVLMPSKLRKVVESPAGQSATHIVRTIGGPEIGHEGQQERPESPKLLDKDYGKTQAEMAAPSGSDQVSPIQLPPRATGQDAL